MNGKHQLSTDQIKYQLNHVDFIVELESFMQFVGLSYSQAFHSVNSIFLSFKAKISYTNPLIVLLACLVLFIII